MTSRPYWGACHPSPRHDRAVQTFLALDLPPGAFKGLTVPFGHKARRLDTSAAGQQLADVGATTHDQPDGRITLLGPNLLEHSIGLTAPPSTSRIAV